MKVWSAIFNIIAVLIMVMFSMAYLNYSKVLMRDFDQARFNQAVEYATEAAFQEVLAIEDIDIEYSNFDVVNVNPGHSLDILTKMLCLSYDLSTSKENMKNIENYIATAVVSGNDGFYIAQLVEDDSNTESKSKGKEFGLKWSPKIPYTYNNGNETYALNLGKEHWVKTDRSGSIKLPDALGYPMGVTKETVKEIANSQITNYIVEEIERRNSSSDTFNYKFFLPSETTKNGVNPIDGPGMLVMLQGADFVSSERMNSVSVSGYKVVNRVNVVAFTETVNGVERKYYCYESQMDPLDIGTRYKVDNYYRNTREAAEAGYHPHYGLLTKKITK